RHRRRSGQRPCASRDHLRRPRGLPRGWKRRDLSGRDLAAVRGRRVSAEPTGDSSARSGACSMTPLRIALVDDEPPARMILREYLEGEPDVEIVAECANGFEAVKAVAELKPDLLLLDVQMPKLDGFEVLELVGRETAVVFTTAYDEYALR